MFGILSRAVAITLTVCPLTADITVPLCPRPRILSGRASLTLCWACAPRLPLDYIIANLAALYVTI